MQIVINGNHFVLLPQRAIYWKEQSALILSDLHLGKAMHFRKAGIAVPHGVMNENLINLTNLIDKYEPAKLIIVGDMFHSVHNNEVSVFDIWRSQFTKPDILLVKGNHDILGAASYRNMDIEVFDVLDLDGFAFAHECLENDSRFCFSGHIHPGIRVDGAGRQSIKLPCFHFTKSACTLPAFGTFTGYVMIRPKEEDKVFAILEKEVIRL